MQIAYISWHINQIVTDILLLQLICVIFLPDIAMIFLTITERAYIVRYKIYLRLMFKFHSPVIPNIKLSQSRQNFIKLLLEHSVASQNYPRMGLRSKAGYAVMAINLGGCHI